MKQKLKKLLPKLILFLGVTIVVVIVLLNVSDLNSVYQVLTTQVDWFWIFIGLICVVAYMIPYPMPLYILGNNSGMKDEHISFGHTMLIGSTEYFFNGITPFSSGGQPFQVYAYSRIGVKASKSTGILLMNFVVYQTAVVIMCIYSLFFSVSLTKDNPWLLVLMIIGISINVLVLAGLCCVGLSKKFASGLSKLVAKICHAKIFKGKLDKKVLEFDKYCVDAQTMFKEILSHKRRFFFSLAIKLASLVAYYLLPYYILKALGVDIYMNMGPELVAMTTLALAMTAFIPTPGATGGIEFAFTSLFTALVAKYNYELSSAAITSGMLLWRLLTYYLLMIISLIIYIIFEFVASKYERTHPKAVQAEPALVTEAVEALDAEVVATEADAAAEAEQEKTEEIKDDSNA